MIVAKHQRIRNELKSRITRGIYRRGQPLPTQSQLMSEYGVAQGTVRQALERLQAEGLVVSQRGKGTFVCEPKGTDGAAARIAAIGLIVISPTENDPLVTDQLLNLQQAAAQHAYELSVRVFTPDEEAAAADWAARLQGVIVWGQGTMSFVNSLVARGVPTVVIGELVDGPCPTGASWIRFDLDALISTAMEMLTGLGHRNIWFINRASSAFFRMLSELFTKYAAATGADPASRELVLERTEDEASLIEHLRDADNPPTALLIEGDIRACRFIHLMHEADWAVPRRVSMIALGAAEPHRLGASDLSRIITPPDIGVSLAVEALAELIDTGRVVRHTVAPRLSFGKTCVPIVSGKGTRR